MTIKIVIRHLAILPAFFVLTHVWAQGNESGSNLSFEEWLKGAQQRSHDQPDVFREQAFRYAEVLERSGSDKIYDLYNLIADSYVAAGNYEESRKYLGKALASINHAQQPEQVVATFFTYGLGYFDERNHAQAYEYFGSALRHAKENKLVCWESQISAEIGNILVDVGDYKRAREILGSIPDSDDCPNFTYEVILADLLTKQEEFSLAFDLYENYLVNASEKSSLLYITEVKAQYVVSLVKGGEVKKAEKVIKEVAHAIETVGVPNPTRLYEWALANLMAAKDEPQQALEYALIALSDDAPIPKEFRLKIDHEALPLIIRLHTELAQLDEAQEMMLRLLENNAQYFANNRAALHGIAEARLNLAAREGEISFLNQQAQVSKLRFERLLLLSAFLALAAIAFVAWVIVLYRNNREKLRFNRRLEESIEKLKARAKGAEVELAHKETLFHEAHHRLKNNFHFLVSVLEIQRSRLSSDTASIVSNVLLDAANRIQAMAVIHHFAYTADKATVGLSIGELFKNLVEQTYHVGDDSIKIHVDCEELEFDGEVSKSLVLIVNELLCNAQKHAFDGKSGNINVVLERNGASGSKLIVEDDGKGFSQDIFKNRNMSMGLKLVRSMVEQISGVLQVDSDKNGTRWTIEF